ncbi:MAG: phosphoenolpyruvate--protein phosphotransferase [Spirochaetes bacterium]|nr:phosphoenolpyruvate--protein phosphotransferase [Spirochaetota bacterium]
MKEISSTFSGIGASAGISIGKIYLYRKDHIVVEVCDISDDMIKRELRRLDLAVRRARDEILAMKGTFEKDVQKDITEILKSHIQILEDPVVLSEVREEVRKQKKNVEHIYNEIMLRFVHRLDAIDNPILKDRANDVLDIRNRVLRQLLSGRDVAASANISEPVIVVAHNLTPSDTLHFDRRYLLGFAVDIGGSTSHTAILSRSLNIPAVVGLQHFAAQAKNGDMMILDGIHGSVIINPSEENIREYEAMREIFSRFQKEHIRLSGVPAKTVDDHVVSVEANIEIPDDIGEVKRFGAEGIGLYRTEFLYIAKESYPSEEEQYHNYKKVVEAFKDAPVTIRTLDLGGDKFISNEIGSVDADQNPFLGWRAIRFCLANPLIFKTQLRAILRASHFGRVSIMFPMVSNVEEYEQAAVLVQEAKDELTKAGHPFDPNVKIGIMVEIPSVAIMAEKFANKVDFFSIGTNDLIQYTLACDRTNERISYLYDPLNLSVLSLIKTTVESAHKAKIPVAICGEMAGQPLYACILIGLGVDALSMAPSLIPDMKRVIRGLSSTECAAFTETLFTLERSSDVRRVVIEYMEKRFPDIISRNKAKDE